MVKNNKIRHKRYNVSQNQFHALHEVDKSIGMAIGTNIQI